MDQGGRDARFVGGFAIADLLQQLGDGACLVAARGEHLATSVEHCLSLQNVHSIRQSLLASPELAEPPGQRHAARSNFFFFSHPFRSHRIAPYLRSIEII